MNGTTRMSRRRFLRLSSAVGVTAIIAACAPPAAAPATSSGGGGEAGAPAAETVKLAYQSREPENAAGIMHLWDEFYAGFRSAHPNVEVEFLSDAGGANRREGALAQMVAGDAPDLMEWCCQNSTFFVQEGQALNLQPFIDQDAAEVNLDDYYANQFNPWKLEGDIYLMPRFTGTMVIYYNKDWFDRKGISYPGTAWGDWNWEKYREIGMAFVGSDPQTWGTSNYGISGNWLTQYWLRGWGTNMVDPDDNTHCQLDDPAALECLEYLRELTWDSKVFVPNASAMSGGIDVTTLFTSERIGMMEMGPWNLNNVMDSAQFRWDVAPIPDGPAGHTTHQSVDGTMIWKGSEHPNESWTLMKGLTSPDYGRLYAKFANKQPSRKSILPEFATLLREQNAKFADISVDVFTSSVAQDIGGPEEMFAKDLATKAQILTPAFDQVMLLGEQGVEFIGRHADVATRFNRGEIPIENLGSELEKLRS